MADKSNQLILDALSRAVAGEAPLHGGKSAPGLFPSTAVGKQAAARCQEEGLLAPVKSDHVADAAARKPRARTAAEPWALSEKGFAYLMGQVSPREVLNDLVRALEGREGQIDDLLAVAHQTRDQLAKLREVTEIVLRQLVPHDAVDGATGGLNVIFQAFLQRRSTAVPPVPEKLTNGDAHRPLAVPSSESWAAAIDKHLTQWHGTGALEDCPLPELYRQACRECPGLTIGEFHDTLRGHHDAGRIYLHPWTGPLYDVPEPPFALLVGHEVAYYASLRSVECGTRNGN